MLRPVRNADDRGKGRDVSKRTSTPSPRLWECPYCGTEKPSPNGTGSDVACCGEVGHALSWLDKVHIEVMDWDRNASE